ncbi:hypothetical protein ACFQ9X_11785 [Catenulispora yoronensis]
MTDTTSTLRRLCWLFPDRESTRTNAKWKASFWDLYSEVAKDLDLTFDRVAPEAVTVDALDVHHPRTYVDGALVTPQDTVFLTSPTRCRTSRSTPSTSSPCTRCWSRPASTCRTPRCSRRSATTSWPPCSTSRTARCRRCPRSALPPAATCCSTST